MMKNRTSQTLFGYWNDVRQGRIAPRRFDIEPARIAGILSETMILELAEGDALRFRLAGTRITEIFTEELRGRNFLELWSAEDRATLERKLMAVRDQGGTLRIEFEASAGSDRHVILEAVLMPLVHTRDVIDRFLGAISPVNHPHWLGTAPLTGLSILNAEIIWPEGRPHAVAEQFQPPALGEHATAGRLVRFNRRQFRVLDGGRPQSEDRN